ncbi:uncharacterized protein EV154DRAFT_521501 [Mucor mucedo]|uniref:uncharacterized protein n=1 Tax=Mucor mucedo TaxID=29922 RepID=UPI002220BD76|nr:uncharacterized protein EV154DRAFT_521501 [Mucor mucedo]KAI7886224.1 hypothetical protein EV154DRAFT_521501 [Mucor mucedo]
MSSQQATTQPLRLRNPTPYHLQQQPTAGHPLTESRPLGFNHDPPTSPIDFNNSFSHNLLNQDYGDEGDFTPMYNRNSFGSSTQTPMDIRRSSTATDATLQSMGRQDYNPVFMPGSLDSAHSLAMSAPSGYDYGYPSNNPSAHGGGGGATGSANNVTLEPSTSGTARSFEDDYTVQMNMQLMMEKRRRRRESHNAGKLFLFRKYMCALCRKED